MIFITNLIASCNILDSFVSHFIEYLISNNYLAVIPTYVLRGHPHKLFIPFCKTDMRKTVLFLKSYICGTLSHVLSLTQILQKHLPTVYIRQIYLTM